MINTASITITLDLLVLIAEVEEFKGAWRAFATPPPLGRASSEISPR